MGIRFGREAPLVRVPAEGSATPGPPYAVSGCNAAPGPAVYRLAVFGLPLAQLAAVRPAHQIPRTDGPPRNSLAAAPRGHRKQPERSSTNNRAIGTADGALLRSEEHTSDLQSLMRISYD